MLLRLLIRFLTLVFAVLLVAESVPGISVAGFWGATVTAVVLSLVNLFIRPVLFILTLPLTLLTFGLFAFILNALMFWLVGYIVEGFEVNGFLPALIGAFIVSAVSYIVSKIASK